MNFPSFSNCILLFYASWQGIRILVLFSWGKNERCSIVYIRIRFPCPATVSLLKLRTLLIRQQRSRCYMWCKNKTRMMMIKGNSWMVDVFGRGKIRIEMLLSHIPFWDRIFSLSCKGIPLSIAVLVSHHRFSLVECGSDSERRWWCTNYLLIDITSKHY